VTRQAHDVLTFAPYAPQVRVSATTGRGLKPLLRTVRQVAEEHDRRVPTGELNRFFEELVAHKPPPLKGNRPVRFYYVSQVAVRPPKFVVTCNYPDAVHFSYQRFIQNQLRERFGFSGTPFRLVFRGRGRSRAER
jgi:GTP-binding protein